MKLSSIFIFLILSGSSFKSFGETADTTFNQPVSVKYKLAGDLEDVALNKLVIDYNDRIYVLTEKGVYRVTGDKLAKDLLYRPLSGKAPIDITTQEGTGYLYYLYENSFLSNARAGLPYGKIPKGKYNLIAVNPDGEVLLSGEKAVGLFKNGQIHPIPTPQKKIKEIKSYKGTFYALTATGVYRITEKGFERITKGSGLQAFSFRGDEIILGTTKGYFTINRHTGDTVLSLQSKIPVRDVKHLKMIDGRLWAGTNEGAFMQKQTGGVRYYASQRWLNENKITGIASDSKGNIYLLTPSGLNQIKFISMTYRKKARHFEKMARQRHIRYGFIAETKLKDPGDLSSSEMADKDNDGLWTSFYLASQAFRYAASGAAEARRYAWESFAAYERLLSINQVKGLPARTFERKGYGNSTYPKEWRPSPDSGWEWKGTTSSDEFVGHIFAAAVMDQFVAKSKQEKKRIADFMDKILMHIIRNDYSFVDIDGKPTLWGKWNPDYVNQYAKTISDRKLASTDLIAGLELGYALTGKELYKKEASRLMTEHGYLENIMISPFDISATPGYSYEGMDMGMGPWNHSDDEMEFLSYWVLYHYAFNDYLKQKFSEAINAFWRIELPERHPLWNLIALGTSGDFDKTSTLWYLREFPMDEVRWPMKNSHRKDLNYLAPNFRQQYTKEVLSPAERAQHHYNRNEFALDLDRSNGGRKGTSGAEYLLPYWMARYLNVIKE